VGSSAALPQSFLPSLSSCIAGDTAVRASSSRSAARGNPSYQRWTSKQSPTHPQVRAHVTNLLETRTDRPPALQRTCRSSRLRSSDGARRPRLLRTQMRQTRRRRHPQLWMRRHTTRPAARKTRQGDSPLCDHLRRRGLRSELRCIVGSQRRRMRSHELFLLLSRIIHIDARDRVHHILFL
jgi:hypothetical protein